MMKRKRGIKKSSRLDLKDSRFSGFGLLCLRRDILGTLPSPSQHQVDDDILMTRRVLLPLDDELAKTMTI